MLVLQEINLLNQLLHFFCCLFHEWSWLQKLTVQIQMRALFYYTASLNFTENCSKIPWLITLQRLRQNCWNFAGNRDTGPTICVQKIGTIGAFLKKKSHFYGSVGSAPQKHALLGAHNFRLRTVQDWILCMLQFFWMI